MHISNGLFAHMVLQRNGKNLSQADFTGTCSATGPIRVRVFREGKPLKGFADRTVGAAGRGRLRGCLAGLPVGGPYTVALRVGDETLAIEDVLVGDVWILGGQSNMQGCGLFPRERIPTDPGVRAFYMDDRWAIAQDPTHNLWQSVDQVHRDLNGGLPPLPPDPDYGVSPGPAFGNEMRRLTNGVPQGLIACAHGGTSMLQWDPQRKQEGGKSLYGALVRRVRKNGGRVAGLLWYQGCSDATAESAPLYTRRMKALIAAIRRDCHAAALPVVIVQISRLVGKLNFISPTAWNSIQEQQRLLPRTIRRLETVPAIDLPLDDLIHISGEGHAVLGVRLARAMQSLRQARHAEPPPITLNRVTVETVRGTGVAVVAFDNVVGGLRAGSRPTGFTVVSQNEVDHVTDVRLDGAHAYIRTTLAPGDLAGASLYYGYGTNPVCTLTDAAGRPLPVFGPIPMGRTRALTPFVRELRVSTIQPGSGNLGELRYPDDLNVLQLTKRTFDETFCNLHPEISRCGECDATVYYAFRFSCAHPMRLALLLGYDGPVKAWMDGSPIFHDSNGTNPAYPDKGQPRVRAGTGEHELIIALGTHNGAAWGIFARLERLDVSLKQIQAGPTAYALPELRD